MSITFQKKNWSIIETAYLRILHFHILGLFIVSIATSASLDPPSF